MRPSKLMQAVIEYAKGHGWIEGRRTRSGIYFTKPGSDPVLVGVMSCEPRAARNALAHLKRQDVLLATQNMQPNP